MIVIGNRTLIIKGTQFNTRRRVTIDQHNNMVAEVAEGSGDWSRMGWLVDARDLLATAMRRALEGKLEIIESPTTVVLELGDLP